MYTLTDRFQHTFTPTPPVPLFLAFCVEQYKKAHGLTGAQTIKSLTETGAIDYLERNYEILHTQSPQWILEEIEDYILNRHLSDETIPRKP